MKSGKILTIVGIILLCFALWEHFFLSRTAHSASFDEFDGIAFGIALIPLVIGILRMNFR